MNETRISAEQVVDMLIAEGYARADVLTAYDSLIESGVEDEANALTAEEVQVLRDQLDSTQPRYTAYEDNAGGVHVSNGQVAWFLGFDEYADVEGWAAGDWEPNEDDGQTPETLADYAEMAARTDSKRIA